ncbi:MAG TPA: hypothetical protein DCZ41_03730 [Firmicutes bacterium]|nr:hypothetical protein [Bacillota bacterium]
MKKSGRVLLLGLSAFACMGLTGGVLAQKALESPALVRAETSSAKLEFTKACGGNGVDTQKNEWIITSDSAESNFDSDKGVHYGTKKAEVSYIEATCTSIIGTISKIVVNCSANSTGTPKVKAEVGGVAFGSEQTITDSNAAYTFEGSASGELVVTVFKDKTQKALYLKSIEVFFSSGSGSSSSSSSSESSESSTTSSSSSAELATFKKVMSNDELVDGSYLIVCDKEKAIFNGSLNALDVANNFKTGNIDGNSISLSLEDAKSWSFFIDEGENGDYSIKSSSGFYIGQTSDANGLKTDASAISNTISINADGADVVSGGAHLRYNAASDQERFRYYKSSSYDRQMPISLYLVSSDEYQPVKEDLEFADALLTILECDATGNTAPSKDDWNGIATTYFDPLSTEAKEYFKKAAANLEGSDIEKAMAKYDYIIAKYGTDNYTDYIGRGVEKIAQSRSLVASEKDNNILAIVSICVFAGTVITAGLFFALKKKKA